MWVLADRRRIICRESHTHPTNLDQDEGMEWPQVEAVLDPRGRSPVSGAMESGSGAFVFIPCRIDHEKAGS